MSTWKRSYFYFAMKFPRFWSHSKFNYGLLSMLSPSTNKNHGTRHWRHVASLYKFSPLKSNVGRTSHCAWNFPRSEGQDCLSHLLKKTEAIQITSLSKQSSLTWRDALGIQSARQRNHQPHRPTVLATPTDVRSLIPK